MATKQHLEDSYVGEGFSPRNILVNRSAHKEKSFLAVPYLDTTRLTEQSTHYESPKSKVIKQDSYQTPQKSVHARTNSSLPPLAKSTQQVGFTSPRNQDFPSGNNPSVNLLSPAGKSAFYNSPSQPTYPLTARASYANPIKQEQSDEEDPKEEERKAILKYQRLLEAYDRQTKVLAGISQTLNNDTKNRIDRERRGIELKIQELEQRSRYKKANDLNAKEAIQKRLGLEDHFFDDYDSDFSDRDRLSDGNLSDEYRMLGGGRQGNRQIARAPIRKGTKLPTISINKSPSIQKKPSAPALKANTITDTANSKQPSYNPQTNYDMQMSYNNPAWQYNQYNQYNPYNYYNNYYPQYQYGMYNNYQPQPMSFGSSNLFDDPYRKFPMNPIGQPPILNDPNHPFFAGSLPIGFHPGYQPPFVYQPPQQIAASSMKPSKPKAERGSHEQNESTPEKKQQFVRKKKVEIRIGQGTFREKLQATCWAIAFPLLLTHEGYSRGKERKKLLQIHHDQRSKEYLIAAQEFVMNELNAELDVIYKEKKAMDLGKKITDKEATQRVTQLIFPKIKTLIDKLISLTNAHSMPREIFAYLASISENQCIPPNGFYFEFELKRLSFNHLGALTEMDELKSKMILCISFFARILIFQFLLMPWQEVKIASSAKKGKPFSSDIPKNENTKKNLKTIGSILMHLIEDMFTTTIKSDLNSQKKIAPKDRIKTIPRGGLFYFADEADNQTKNEKLGQDQIIVGLYTRAEISIFYKNYSVNVEQLRSALNSWTDHMYLLTHTEYTTNRKLHVFGTEDL